jgi:hypothetical protein
VDITSESTEVFSVTFRLQDDTGFPCVILYHRFHGPTPPARRRSHRRGHARASPSARQGGVRPAAPRPNATPGAPFSRRRNATSTLSRTGNGRLASVRTSGLNLRRRSAHQIPNYLKEGVQLIDNIGVRHRREAIQWGTSARYSVADTLSTPALGTLGGPEDNGRLVIQWD